MTAPDPRLDEIQARLDADWEASMAGGYIGDDQCMKDRDYLLAELRKAHEALERVEGVIAKLSDWAGRYKSAYYDEAQDDVVQIIRPVLRAAVAAAKGDERG